MGNRVVVDQVVPAVLIDHRADRPPGAGSPRAGRRPAVASAAPAGDAVVAEMVRLYRDEGRSLRAVGVVVGCGADTVRARLGAAGIEIRSAARRTAPRVDAAAVRRCLDTGMTVAEVARDVGRPAGVIRQALRSAGLPVPPRRPPPPALDVAVLRELYIGQELSIAPVAARLSSTPSRVATALRSAGVPRRSPWDRPNAAGPAISAGQLTDLYVNQGLTARQVAAELGCPLSQVAAALTRHRITRPVFPVTFDVDRATLTRLYVTEQLDDTVIAARYDVPPWRVTRRRRELDVHRPRIHRPPRPTPPAHLHGPSPGQSLPTAAVTATRHRSTTRTVRARPTRAGINTAPHARHGPPTPVGDDPALADLYTDPEVTGWRRRHQIPRRPHPAGGADTDPPATTLTRPLLRQAYQQIGLSVRQLAVLTGQPTNHVLHALAAAGIPPPTDNDTSPWQARHRAQTDRHRREPPR